MLSILILGSAAAAGFDGLESCKPNENQSVDIVGVATDPVNGSVLYCEWHNKRDNKTTVTYVTASGEAFAEKHLDYSNSEFKPEYTQSDFRFGEFHKVELNGDAYTFLYREEEAAETKTTSIKKSKVDVIDAGFDAKTRDLWQQLQRGDPLSIEFGSTVFQKTLALRVIKRQKSECSGWDNLEAQQHACYKIEPDNWFIRVFFSGLELIYHNETKRLVQFEGPVNIKGADKRKLNARIRYHYKSQ